MSKLQRVVIMAGGTGGHVFPGLAVARYLRDQGVEVHWLGTERGLEARLVPEEGFPIHYLPVKGMRGKTLKALASAPWQVMKALGQSVRLMKKLNPQVVIGLGGYVSGPGGLASWLLRYPLVIHEQNAKAGMTNKILSHFANKVLEGFPHAFPQGKKVITTGNPVRHDLTVLPPPAVRFSSPAVPFRLLVIGGSLGAQVLNKVVPQALALIHENQRPMVQHQTGEKLFVETKQAYEQAGVQAEIMPFISEMNKAYSNADMVLCRSGALTIAELCTVGIGAILVPYPHAVDDHQTANANFMVQNGAAMLVQQPELTAEYLAEILREFSQKPEKRLAMAEAAFKLRRDGIVEKIFHVLKETAL